MPEAIAPKGVARNEDMVDERILHKLQKLLALAGSDNEHEAKLALSRAEALMRAYRLNLADVALDGSDAHVDDLVVEARSRALPHWEIVLADEVADAFDGRVLILKSPVHGRGDRLHFIAGQTDLIVIVDLFERLRQAVARQSAHYVKWHESWDSRLAGQSYRAGMLKTIGERLRALKANSRPDGEAKPGSLSGKELIQVKCEAVDRRLAELYPKTGSFKTRLRMGDDSAYEHGRRDGGKLSLHRSVPGGNGDGPAALGQSA